MTDGITPSTWDPLVEPDYRLARWLEWDEGRVWLDGQWWEVDHYGTVDPDGFCRDVVMRRMDPQP